MENQEVITQVQESNKYNLRQKNFEIISITLHHIDVDNKKVISPEKKLVGADFKEYLDNLIEDVIKKGDDRRFKLIDTTTQVYSEIVSTINTVENYEISANVIAKKLLRAELDAKDKVKQMQTLQKGSLIQAVIEVYGRLNYILTKVEHDAFIDEIELKKRFGLASKKTNLKSCLFCFTDDKEIESITLADTNSSISKFWWSTFLELGKSRTDDDNTINTYNALKSLINKTIKQASPKDGYNLRNSLIVYFTNNKSFNYSEMYESVFKNYEPIDEKYDYKKFLTKIDKLKDTDRFDTSFEITKEIIKDKLKDEYKVTNKVTIKINGEILKNDIKSETIKGEKVLIVKVDDQDTFDTFAKINK